MMIKKSFYKYRSLLLSIPILWIVIFWCMPIILLLFYSFHSRGSYGELLPQFSLNNYKEIVDSTYFSIFLRTFLTSISTTLLSLFVAYPVAYYIAFKSKSPQVMLTLIVLPLWTSYLARTYSWITILGKNGIINTYLIKLGIINTSIEILFTPFATLIGLLCNYLPFMILTLYITQSKINKSYVEAARDLGASSFNLFREIIIPLSKPGIINGCILVFAFSMADYVIPNILGGSKQLLLSNLIVNQFIIARNIPLGSSLSVILILLTVLLICYQYKNSEIKDEN